MTEVELLKKIGEEQLLEQTLKQPPEQPLKTYTTNTAMFEDACTKVFGLLTSNKNKVLDLGSDKPPQFASYLANKYPESSVIHFKDTKTTGRVDVSYKPKNLSYVFSKRKLKETSFDIATAFFTLHEFPTRWRKPELGILHKCLKQDGKIVVIDYDLPWVQKENLSEEDFIREVFTEGNEKRVMKTELNCMETHTSLGLENYIEELASVGFKEKYSEKYHIQTSWGTKPKISLYIGEKA